MAVLALVFGAAVVVLIAVVIRGIATSRRSAWEPRTETGDSAWMFMGSDGGGGGGDGGGADCSSSDGGGGCDGGGGGD